MELVIQKVLDIVAVNSNSKNRKDKTSQYVIPGKNFGKSKPKDHEIIFLKPFVMNRNIQIAFKNYIKTIHENCKGNYPFKKSIRSNELIKPLFKRDILSNFLHLTKHSNTGETTKKEILAYLQHFENNFSKLIKDNKEKAMELLLSIGGNVLLYKNFDYKLLGQFDKAFLNDYKRVSNGDYATESGWWYFSEFDVDDFDYFHDTYENVSSDFDSHDYSDSGSNDSGCSSCSGCGGCGGCGGCS